MSDPVVYDRAPTEFELEPGEYWWCACGRSMSQPFCDGSHKGTGFAPTAFTAEKTDTVFLCGCKHTANKPYCDGTHKTL